LGKDFPFGGNDGDEIGAVIDLPQGFSRHGAGIGRQRFRAPGGDRSVHPAESVEAVSV
jgi:hypothetical protein